MFFITIQVKTTKILLFIKILVVLHYTVIK